MTHELTTIEHLRAALKSCDEAGSTIVACYIQMALDLLNPGSPDTQTSESACIDSIEVDDD